MHVRISKTNHTPSDTGIRTNIEGVTSGRNRHKKRKVFFLHNPASSKDFVRGEKGPVPAYRFSKERKNTFRANDKGPLNKKVDMLRPRVLG